MSPSNLHSMAGADLVEPAHGRRGDRKSRRGPLDQEDLIAGLWREAPFARLPHDAPQGLRDLVQDVDNPHRVYTIHRASRRHGFQLLVARYVLQLREGCGNKQCSTSTCFTLRKRLVGKSPIRRYSPNSARTLAVYLASQDNPDRGLCPYLRRSNDPPVAVNTLVFSALFPLPASTTDQFPKTQHSPKKDLHPDSSSSMSEQAAMPSVQGDANREESPATAEPAPKLSIHERATCKDHRSFAAAAFGTVAFKMLEWLTPQGIEHISKELAEIGQVEPSPNAEGHDTTTVREAHRSPDSRQSLDGIPRQDGKPRSTKHIREKAVPISQQEELAPPTRTPAKPKHGSRGSVRAPSTSNRRASVEPLPTPAPREESKSTPKSQPLNSFHPHTARMAPNAMSRPLPEFPLKPAFFENVPCLSPQPVDDVVVDPGSSDKEDSDDLTDTVTSPLGSPLRSPAKVGVDVDDLVMDASERRNCLLPQSLPRLDVEVVDFICDVFQEDYTFEKRFVGPLSPAESFPAPQNRQRKLAPRRRRSDSTVPRRQWKAFNEQTLFDVLSNPRSLVGSFTKDGKLYDSLTMWYCMLRMTRVAPSLVLHSLWLAARCLFVPPEALKSLRSQASNLFSGDAAPLTNFEASCVMSVCLHALVASAPYVTDTKTLFDMSRIRSHGVVGGRGTAIRQPPSMCLEYEDAFSNDLALRLARRLFCAITARRYFVDVAECDSTVDTECGDLDILRPMLRQLDSLGSDAAHILEFAPQDRLLHEARMPTLLLDWARTILLQDWDGEPEFSSDGPFYGAMSLMETMYEKRDTLLVPDVQFRVDYFSDRLDTLEMPVAWTGFTSTRQRHHLLDYPYLFSPETAVTFFRSINFSKMSRTFEESSSLKTRMNAIVDPGSLVTNPHHKVVLQDLLRTASSKYLVLDIGRQTVIRDAFDQLWRRQERELLRPLKIHLGEDGGEEGFDSGGVQQEFFRMAIAECLDPTYGAFTIDERTRMAWFVPDSVVEDWKFEMMGLLVSLAVYNGLTLPLTFPNALYRKLLGQSVNELYHVADGWPELAAGLTTLLEWDENEGLIEDVFARTYEFSVSSFGTHITREMAKEHASWPRGLFGEPSVRSMVDEAPLVTNDNRNDYVSDYIRYLTDVSVRPQYLAFERGFRACLDGKSLSLLSPATLQSLVEGVQEINISELRRHARYVGWDSSHRTIKDFWSIVKRYDDRLKRKLLEFVTASDRVPVGGMRNLQFVVQRNGEETGKGGHLPTAYTCYGTLLLPEYKDKDLLRERLGMALENAQGFGFA
ncbi:HECT domain-containing protein [Drechmeria coniospora]|uniref:HECT-type E3 ubiquitin transferase n=1 Tax=Drechmeria coniospora TaxID=98403 RepID=A0A151GVD7_DRECN|nr:HECT domain-containing protein [Drechmeria coniospora]KYK61066.1 HECT domain-containing protein [Drechmeria coniospora]